MKDILRQFEEWAKKNNWQVTYAQEEQKLNEEVLKRYKSVPKQWYDFIVNFSDIMNSTDDMWFLTCENYLEGIWGYNDFENMSLESADGDDEWTEEIKEFWDNTMPIIMSIGGDYQYFGIEIDSGRVVHGYEAEFEYPTVVADSFEEFMEKVFKDEILLIG